MQTIRIITQEIFQNRVITSDHIHQINTRLRRRQFDELDEVALRHLIQSLIDGEVRSDSPCLNLFLATN